MKKAALSWIDGLSDALSGQPPDGWHTIRQAAIMSNKSESCVRKRVTEMLASGELVSRKYRLKGDNGRMGPVMFYGPK